VLIPNCKLQLVSLAQAGNEITQDSLKSEGEVCFTCFSISHYVGLVDFECLTGLFMVVTADLSTMDPPVMEGVDQLVAVSLKLAGSCLF
jgi:hypothetical protein